MTVTSTMPRRAYYWLKSEGSPDLHRESVTLAAGSGKCDTGLVLGRISVGAAAVAPLGSNTGDGAITLDAAPVRANAKVGVYTVRCVEAVADGGVFEVQDPDGAVIGSVSVGVTGFADGVAFTIGDGAADFVLGDGFDITVAGGSGLWAPCDITATDGRQIPAGILLAYRDATTEARPAVAVRGDAEVLMSELRWHASIDTVEKRRAIMTQLDTLRIRNRRAA